MYVSHNGDGRRYRLNIGFFEELRLDDAAERLHLRLRQRPALLNLRQPGIKIRLRHRYDSFESKGEQDESTRPVK